MECIVVKKWLEPYVVLETLKKSYGFTDLTFDSFTKVQYKNKMLSEIEENIGKAFGLYMKNVNKFFIFKSEDKIDSDSVLNIFNLTEDDYEKSNDTETALQAIDLARAEVTLIF